jgi:hypothetical protein
MTTSTPGTEGVELARMQYFKSSFGMVIALTFKGTAVVPTQSGFRISRSGKSISASILDSASYPDPLGERMAGWYPPTDSSEGDDRDRPVPEKARVEGRRPSPRRGAVGRGSPFLALPPFALTAGDAWSGIRLLATLPPRAPASPSARTTGSRARELGH